MFPIELLEGKALNTDFESRSIEDICKKLWGEETFNRINNAMVEEIKASLSSDQPEHSEKD